MKKTLRNSSVLLAIFLTGCGGSSLNYSDLRKLNIQGQDFNAALSREYKSFALYENDEMGDWNDASHFKKKAFLVALATPDGTREPRNRRVEIILGEAPSL